MVLISCGKGDQAELVTVSDLRLFQVEAVDFEGDFTELGVPEIEVHWIDEATGQSVLCSGLDHGMQAVKVAGVDYQNLDASFVPTRGSTQATLDHFKIKIIERDSQHCPDPPDEVGHKVVGETKSLQGKDLSIESHRFKNQDKGYVALTKRGVSTSSLTIADLSALRLQKLKLARVDAGEASSPDVEIHAVDLWSGQVLACIGANEGLSRVTLGQYDYDNLYAPFVPATDLEVGTTADWVRLVAVERDEGECPDPFDPHYDQILGTSTALSLEQLEKGEEIVMPGDLGSLTVSSLSSLQGSVSPYPISSLQSLRIQKIRFYGSYLEAGDPEIEVHLYDALTGQPIACAGASEGLGGVDSQETVYSSLNTAFNFVWQGAGDPAGLIRVVIVERDTSACPEEPSRQSNDFLAEVVVPVTDLTTIPISFDNNSEIEFLF